MITALISFQIVKFIIVLLLAILFAFSVFVVLMFFSNKDKDFKFIFTKTQKQQLDSLLNIYVNLYLIDEELDEENKDKIKTWLLGMQTDVMLLAEDVAGKNGLGYVQIKMEYLKSHKL